MAPGNADLIADVGSSGVSLLGRAAPRLAAAFRAAPRPYVLMLDDLHVVRSPDCHDVLNVAISGVPSGSQVVFASRSEVPHMRPAAGDGRRVRTASGDDLVLDATGAAQIFSLADVQLTRSQAVAVTERTEGWPVGLYLAALIQRDGGETEATVAGDDRYVADYLYREAHAQLLRQRPAVSATYGCTRPTVCAAV